MANFLQLLLDKNRLHLFEDMALEFNRLISKDKGVINAHVISSMPMIEEDLLEITSILEDKFANKFILTHEIDAAIIGGIVIKYGSTVIDASILGQLNMIDQRSKAKIAEIH